MKNSNLTRDLLAIQRILYEYIQYERTEQIKKRKNNISTYVSNQYWKFFIFFILTYSIFGLIGISTQSNTSKLLFEVIGIAGILISIIISILLVFYYLTAKRKNKRNNIIAYISKQYWKIFTLFTYICLFILTYSIFGLIGILIQGQSISKLLFDVIGIAYIFGFIIISILLIYCYLIVTWTFLIVEIRCLNPISEKVVIDLSVVEKNNYFLYKLSKYDKKSISYFKVQLKKKIFDLERKRSVAVYILDIWLPILVIVLLLGIERIAGIDINSLWIAYTNKIGIPLLFICLSLFKLVFNRIKPKIINHYEDFLAIIDESEIARQP